MRSPEMIQRDIDAINEEFAHLRSSTRSFLSTMVVMTPNGPDDGARIRALMEPETRFKPVFPEG